MGDTEPGVDFGMAGRRRASLAGCMLFAGLLAAAGLVAWGGLQVRQRAGQRYVQALADSHAREVGHELARVETEFRALAVSLGAVDLAATDAMPQLLREGLAGIGNRNPALAGLRLEAGAPGFIATGADPTRLHLGRSVPDAQGNWRLPVAMRVPSDAQGEIRWLRAELDEDVFSGVLRVHEVGNGGVASVLGHDGILLARSDTGVLHAGLQAPYSPVMGALRQAPGGVVRSTSRLDGIVRVVGYRSVSGWPLVATVGIPPGVLHAGWWTFVGALALGVLLLMAAWGGGLYMLRRAARREEDMRRSLSASENTVGSLRERVRDAYRFLYEQHPLPAVVYDRDTLRVLEVNEAAALQYRLPRQALVGQPMSRMLAQGTTEAEVRDEIRNFPRAYGRRIWSHRRGDGSPFSALVFARDISSFDGRPARLMLALDVTEQVRAEGDLRLLRRAVEASGEGVFIVDAARRELVYGNEAFVRLCGLDATQHLPVTRAAVDTIADDEVRTILRSAIERGVGTSVEVAGLFGLEGEHWREIRLSPVRGADGGVTHFVGILTDITERRFSSRDLAWRANHEALTGLLNRDAFVARIDEAIEAAQAAGDDAGIVVCMINLDRFKLINDSLGSVVGDEVLVTQARRLEQAAAATDVVGGLGGDEFSVLLRGTSGAQAAERAEALRAAVSQPVPVRGIQLLTTASLGYACYPGDGRTGAELLRVASRAVDRAKHDGRNRSVAYHSGLDPHAAERLALVQELHRALQEEQFELEFQLKFDVCRRPVGMEALVRWRHPERGLLGPDAFMDACEESGLVMQLGSWVLDQAARCWQKLDQRGHGGLRMGVNVSALQVRPELVDEVAAVMARYGISPGALELELTESVLLANPAAAAGIMQSLSALGASIAIDDFGTGYSSMAYLQHLPLQRLKLDRSFVHGLDSGPDGQAICYAILGLAQALGLGVTAEGVENTAQHEWLSARGCGEFQGYLLARPVPFDALVAEL